jgi:hypothetical protein
MGKGQGQKGHFIETDLPALTTGKEWSLCSLFFRHSIQKGEKKRGHQGPKSGGRLHGQLMAQ